MRLTQTLYRAFQYPVADRAVKDGAALSLGINIVRKVLKENPNTQGWRTGEIYDLVLKEPAPLRFSSALPISNIPTPPPNPEHPIRSKQFLKEILSHMEGYRDIKLHRDLRTREGSTSQSEVFVWKPVLDKKLPKPKPSAERKPTVAQAIGGHEDWGHLNRRRLRARRAKILKLVHDLKGTKIELEAY